MSVSADKYLLINTEHRENYDDFRISASDYGFLNGVDRFLSCSRLFAFGPSKIKQKVGMLSEADTKTVIEKIGASGRIGAADKAVIRAELLAASFSGSG